MKTIENPATGETTTILESTPNVLRLEMRADRCNIPRHLHPKLSEHWELQDGRVEYELAGRHGTLTAPAQLAIPAGVVHSFTSTGPIRTIVENRPAGGFEQFIETVYALARDGKTNAKGTPNLLRAAVIANAHRDDYALPFPPLPVQRVLFALLAPVGRLLGYRPTYP